MIPFIGENILYVLASGPNAGAARLGFITNVLDNGKVSITCLPDAANDRIGHIYTAVNVPFGPNKTPGTWHRPLALNPTH
jgi:hypothetical protein